MKSTVFAVAVAIVTAAAQPSVASDTKNIRAAAQVFGGAVRSTTHENGSVLIKFYVEDAIKGTTAGEEFQWREWDGSWQSGPRYRAGERLIVFLRPAAASGLTSPLKVLKVEAGLVPLQKRSPRLGAGKTSIRYSDYIRALRGVQ